MKWIVGDPTSIKTTAVELAGTFLPPRRGLGHNYVLVRVWISSSPKTTNLWMRNDGAEPRRLGTAQT